MSTDSVVIVCNGCSRSLSLDCFYDHPKGLHGKLIPCKECRRAKARAINRSPVGRARDTERYRTQPHRKELNRQHSERYGSDPIKHVAEMAAQKERRRMNRLGIPRVCTICGAPGQLHHGDYNKPDEMRLLCQRHHSEAHRLYD